MPARSRAARLAYLAFTLLLLVARSAVGQTPLHIWPYSLPLADVSVTSTAAHGLTLYFAPGVNTTQGRDSARLVSLTFHPDSALAWVDRVARLNHAGDRADLPDGMAYSRPLATTHHDGSVAIGVEFKHGHPRGQRSLGLVEGSQAWRVLLSAIEVDSLMSLVFLAATESYLSPYNAATIPPERDNNADEQPVTIVHQALPPSKGDVGRVLATYVVGTDGRVDSTSIVVLLATSPALVDMVRTTLRESIFKPALRFGEPVRALVQQTFAVKPWR